MIAADSSVAIAAALRWHDLHREAVSALRQAEVTLPAHASVEAYSVLTRLRAPRGLAAGEALRFLRTHFRLPLIALSAERYEWLLELSGASGVVGGAIYDAVVAATALDAGATLLTLDQRAERVYRLVGVDYRLLG